MKTNAPLYGGLKPHTQKTALRGAGKQNQTSRPCGTFMTAAGWQQWRGIGGGDVTRWKEMGGKCKEHVENGVIELYFVNTEYQLADIFTKSLGRERIEFLINKLGIQSFTPESLKKLTDDVDE
ncbi:hypothetical protein Tco_1132227 [Tanacetum coccineum]|uniref:Uncharacterized protein n=1 Tax=Tanacetum coccineum TaxID=301880 RepID=A0ABQ5JCF4_9ASTR